MSRVRSSSLQIAVGGLLVAAVLLAPRLSKAQALPPVAQPLPPAAPPPPAPIEAAPTGSAPADVATDESLRETPPMESPPPALAAQPPPATATDSAAVEELDAAAQAELDAILADQSAQDVAQDGPSLHIYGFADANISKAFPQTNRTIYPRAPASFLVGNVNLYAAADLTRGFSSLLEVRFTYMPNGSLTGTSLEYASTAAADIADWYRIQRWGGIVLERVHLDYSVVSWLNLRFGSFLTPYGIWNVDHGSPIIIPVHKPYIIGEQLFPTRQVGLAAFGSFLLGSTTLGYHLTLSNGRGDIEQIDFDRNKAVGGRLFLSRAHIGNLTLGVSAYGGMSSLRPRVVGVSVEELRARDEPEIQFRELSLAADLLWEWRGLRVQWELVSQQVAYEAGGREAVALSAPPAFIPDHHAWGTYLLVGYRLPWFGIMPFAMYSHLDRGYGERGAVLFTTSNTVSPMGLVGGINVRPVPAVALKAQFTYIWVPEGDRATLNPVLSFQAAWAF